MRFKLDENMPRRARQPLESRGWEVHDVHQEGLASATDRPIQEACEREQRVLVTLDTDFAALGRRARSPADSRPSDRSLRMFLWNIWAPNGSEGLNSVIDRVAALAWQRDHRFIFGGE